MKEKPCRFRLVRTAQMTKQKWTSWGLIATNDFPMWKNNSKKNNSNHSLVILALSKKSGPLFIH